MKKIVTSISLCILTGTFSFGQNDVEFSVSDGWSGYMNVFDINGATGGPGGYQFGSAWGISDLQSLPDTNANRITLHPNFNTYVDNPADPFWVDQGTGEGNKYMEASTYVEPGPTFNGVDLSFSGYVYSHTLDSNYEAHFFIKALDSTNNWQDALAGAYVQPLPASGPFSVSVTAAQIPSGLVVQYGFAVKGINANPADEQTLGNVVIGADTTGGVGIAENFVEKFSVYPNPANDMVYFKSTVDHYEVMNLAGQRVLSGELTNSMDIRQLQPGSYWIQATVKGEMVRKQFVKR